LIPPVSEVTGEERDYSLTLLSESHDRLVAAVSGLSEEQWRFKPASDRWSVADLVEHIVVTEAAIHIRVFGGLQKGPPPDPSARVDDALLVGRVGDRSTKFSAPERLAPSGRWDKGEALRRLGELRQKTMEIARNPSGFREHTIPHPIFGPLDGYQWVLTTAGHGSRHTDQILEVLRTPGFPAAE
jgi:hypothetical protein